MREDILRERYYWKDPQGNPMEDWAGLCRRVAGNLSNDEDEEEEDEESDDEDELDEDDDDEEDDEEEEKV